MSSATLNAGDAFTCCGTPCLLVPLDGSERAEATLPIAAAIAQATHASLLLGRVTPFLGIAPASVGVPLPNDTYQQLIDDERRAASAYLDEQAELLWQQGLAVETHIAHGDPAAILLDVAAQRHVSLIVMSTHGRTGFARFALGSVADRLVHYGHLPILLLRSIVPVDTQEKQSAALPLDRALVPLDGSAFAEAALDRAVELAGTLVHRITLLRVLSYTARRTERLEAAEYLETRCHALHQALMGRECLVDTLLLDGTMAGETIARQAAEEGSLVIMATHGRTGISRWVLGSEAAQVVHASHVPVLLVHPVPDVPRGQQPTDPVQRDTEPASTLPRTPPLRTTAQHSMPEETARHPRQHERIPAAAPPTHRE